MQTRPVSNELNLNVLSFCLMMSDEILSVVESRIHQSRIVLRDLNYDAMLTGLGTRGRWESCAHAAFHCRVLDLTMSNGRVRRRSRDARGRGLRCPDRQLALRRHSRYRFRFRHTSCLNQLTPCHSRRRCRGGCQSHPSCLNQLMRPRGGARSEADRAPTCLGRTASVAQVNPPSPVSEWDALAIPSNAATRQTTLMQNKCMTSPLS